MMKEKRIASRLVAVIALVASFAILASFSSCKYASHKKKKDRVVIGFSIATDTFIIERWNKDIKIFSGAARDLGADLIVQLSAGGWFRA